MTDINIELVYQISGNPAELGMAITDDAAKVIAGCLEEYGAAVGIGLNQFQILAGISDQNAVPAALIVSNAASLAIRKAGVAASLVTLHAEKLKDTGER